MKKLSLNSNSIDDISVLSKVNFKKLKELYLSHNQISDINVFETAKFDELELLDLMFNKVAQDDEENESSIVVKLRKKIKKFYLYEVD